VGADDTLTLRALWSRTTELLGEQHEARWLCEVASSLDGDDFRAALDEPVTDSVVRHLDRMLVRFRAGEPLQYVLGRWAFRRLDLAVDRRVLIPRPETELVVDVVLELLAAVGEPRLVADLGTGSGAIGLALATELPLDATTVWITDVSDNALAVARANLAGIGRAARNVRVGEGSWFDALPVGELFDVIVSNPPYVADRSEALDESVREWEPERAVFAGPDGLDAIRVLVGGARAHLRPGGWLVIEIGADQGDVVRDLLASTGYGNVGIRRDLAGHDRIALARHPT